jgi:serine/threonine protein kinase
MLRVKSASGSAEAKPSVKICPTCGERFGMDALFCPNDGSPLAIAQPGDAGVQPGAPDPYLGREMLGHIEIRQLVGVGAMGRVYRAFQKGIDRDVAVKILHRELSANQQLVARFHREAKVASRLLHPNVVGVHLAGQLPDGAMYIVMEYLDGLSLQSALAAAGGAFDLPRALHVALQLCDATGEAHATGVVHRDLKPENVMLVRRGADTDFVKVLDFGIARLNWGEQSMATAAGLIFGTARYISPEGAQGEAVGPTGDVYATATLVYQMLAGRTPFEGEQAVALLVQQIHDAPPPLRSHARASYVPEPIAQTVMRNLAKDPLAREPDGRALGRALLDAARLAGLSAEDFVARPMMQSGRPPPVHVPSLQRTANLQLVPGAPRPVEPSRPVEHGPRPAEPRQPAFASTPPQAPPPPLEQQGALETTLDDIEPPAPLKQASPAPGAPSPRFERTQQIRPLESHELHEPSIALSAPPVRGSMPSMDDPALIDEAPAPIVETPEIARRRSRSRTVFLFVACFLVGVIGAATFAYRMGYVGPKAQDAQSLDGFRRRAREALRDDHWDTPPGKNVRDVTTQGLARYPNDPQLVSIRTQAADEIVKDAIGEKYLGHDDQAVHLAKLAHELDPKDATAARLAVDYAQPAQAAVVDAGAEVDAHVAVKHNPTPATTTSHTHVVAPPEGVHGVIDLAPARPTVAVPVAVTIHITVGSEAPKALPEAEALTVSGPDVPPGTLIPILAQGPGTVRGALTFNEPGKFELVFTAKVDGHALKVSRAVVVPGAPKSGGNTQATDAGKWL